MAIDIVCQAKGRYKKVFVIKHDMDVNWTREDDGSVFMAFAVGDFVNADTLKATNSVSITYTGDTTVLQIGKG